jgi:hypothetical protein
VSSAAALSVNVTRRCSRGRANPRALTQADTICSATTSAIPDTIQRTLGGIVFIAAAHQTKPNVFVARSALRFFPLGLTNAKTKGHLGNTRRIHCGEGSRTGFVAGDAGNKFGWPFVSDVGRYYAVEN